MGIGRFFKAFLLLAGFCLAAMRPMSLGAQALDRWFSKPAVSESYGSVKVEIMTAAEEFRRLSLPEELLLSRLEEAAIKNVSAAALLAGIHADMDYLRMIVEDFRARNLLPAKEKEAVKAVQNALLIVRAGIEEIELETALDLASSQAELKGKPSAILSRAFAALGVTASAKAVYGLSESSRSILAEYLITSRLTDRKFDSVMAEIAERIKKGETAELAVSSLGNNGDAAGKPDNPAPGREKSKGSERPGKENGRGAGAGSNSNQNDSPSKGTGSGLKPGTNEKGY